MSIYYKIRAYLEKDFELKKEVSFLENNAIAVANRKTEYGSTAEQIEYITENGLEAWQSKVQEIKTKYPKENS